VEYPAFVATAPDLVTLSGAVPPRLARTGPVSLKHLVNLGTTPRPHMWTNHLKERHDVDAAVNTPGERWLVMILLDRQGATHRANARDRLKALDDILVGHVYANR
jgi:hypothetical protein